MSCWSDSVRRGNGERGNFSFGVFVHGGHNVGCAVGCLGLGLCICLAVSFAETFLFLPVYGF